MIEHGPETNPADVAVGWTVDRVAEGHVIGRHCFRDGPGGAAYMKKAARYFLPRANFSKGPIALGIEINLERFLIRSDIHLGFHNFQDVGIYRASQPPSSRLPESLSSRAKSRDPDAKS